MWAAILTHRAIPWPLISLGAIGLPEKRLKILKCIRSTFGSRLDVVDFPAVFRVSVAVIGILHCVAACVASPNRSIVAINRSSLLPYGQFGLLVGVFERVCVCHGFYCGEIYLPNVKSDSRAVAR